MGSKLIWGNLGDLQVNVNRQNRLVRSLTMVLWFLTVVLALFLGFILESTIGIVSFFTLPALVAIAIVLVILIISILIFIKGLRSGNSEC